MLESTQPASALDGTVPSGAGSSALRTPLTGLIGRESEIAVVSALLQESRLVTLTGAGGTGKTRLAQAVMRGLATETDRTAFVDLATLDDPGLVVVAILTSLGARASSDQSPLDLVVDLIGGSDSYLILDNFEHVTSAAPVVMELLQRCPRLVVLVTSRRRLKLSAERIYEVPPLTVPPLGERIEAVVGYESVRLFLDRAAEAGGSIGPGDMLAVADICRRLEGLPLAIELAAAHARYLSVQALLGRLDEPLPLLAGGPVDAPVRQRALQHSITWSYDLLDQREKTLFGRLGAFEGPFRLAAAHQVTAESLYDSEAETLEALADLADHGLILSDPADDGDARFRMHDAIRDFAKGVMGDGTADRDRMLDYYVRLAEQAEAELERVDAAIWTRLLASEMENLRGALNWAYKSAAGISMLRLASALGNFWRWHGDLREGREWLSRAVITAEPGHEGLLAKAQMRAARMYRDLGDRSQALLLSGSARRNAEAASDVGGVAEALMWSAALVIDDGRPDEAEAMLEEGLELARSADNRAVLAAALLERGLLDHYRGDFIAARERYEHAAEIALSVGNIRLAAVALVNSADTKMIEFDFQSAVRLATKGAAYLDACDDMAYAPWAHLLLGLAHRRLDDSEEARREIRIGATKALQAGTPVDVIFAAEVIGDWLGAAGKSHAALVSWAAAASAREDLDYPRQPWDDAWINAGIERDRSAESAKAVEQAWKEGEEVGIREAVSAGLLALGSVPHAPPGSRHFGARTHDKRSLTPREAEILRLVAEGLHDKEIAKILSIRTGTVAVHVSSLRWKLGAGSRVELATTAIRKSLVGVQPG
jgi:predicted ATPase/DNA-binding CsgD family transcriptional regulator